MYSSWSSSEKYFDELAKVSCIIFFCFCLNILFLVVDVCFFNVFFVVVVVFGFNEYDEWLSMCCFKCSNGKKRREEEKKTPTKKKVNGKRLGVFTRKQRLLELEFDGLQLTTRGSTISVSVYVSMLREIHACFIRTRTKLNTYTFKPTCNECSNRSTTTHSQVWPICRCKSMKNETTALKEIKENH